jgi:hypothetical protein
LHEHVDWFLTREERGWLVVVVVGKAIHCKYWWKWYIWGSSFQRTISLLKELWGRGTLTVVQPRKGRPIIQLIDWYISNERATRK